MSRKMVDFVFRQIELNRIEEGKSAEDWRAWVRDNYLLQGWEILSTEIARAEANSVFLGISLVRYAEEPAPSVEKRGPGRPPKAVEDAVS
jgi:hypothetical protein